VCSRKIPKSIVDWPPAAAILRRTRRRRQAAVNGGRVSASIRGRAGWRGPGEGCSAALLLGQLDFPCWQTAARAGSAPLIAVHRELRLHAVIPAWQVIAGQRGSDVARESLGVQRPGHAIALDLRDQKLVRSLRPTAAARAANGALPPPPVPFAYQCLRIDGALCQDHRVGSKEC